MYYLLLFSGLTCCWAKQNQHKALIIMRCLWSTGWNSRVRFPGARSETGETQRLMRATINQGASFKGLAENTLGRPWGRSWQITGLVSFSAIGEHHRVAQQESRRAKALLEGDPRIPRVVSSIAKHLNPRLVGWVLHWVSWVLMCTIVPNVHYRQHKSFTWVKILICVAAGRKYRRKAH